MGNQLQYDNRALVVPEYTDQDIGNLPALVFPFSDKYMTYDKRTHQYFLTPGALIEFGIKVDEQDDAAALKGYLRAVTNAVYSAIKVKAGSHNYSKMAYRIAKGLGSPDLSPLDFRNQFLFDVMIVQARHMANGNAKDAPKVIMTSDSGRLKSNDLNVDDLYWLHDDVIITLQNLNLLNPQRILESRQIHWDEY